jgi:hypothetical protein
MDQRRGLVPWWGSFAPVMSGLVRLKGGQTFPPDGASARDVPRWPRTRAASTLFMSSVFSGTRCITRRLNTIRMPLAVDMPSVGATLLTAFIPIGAPR